MAKDSNLAMYLIAVIAFLIIVYIVNHSITTCMKEEGYEHVDDCVNWCSSSQNTLPVNHCLATCLRTTY
jgi:hypothetical protein